ncbi:MAG: DUF4315 family protein [Erysipelotrichaceae bacterium]|nr:DUF4315 family protein [Erysipelotrichaceae bacterium]
MSTKLEKIGAELKRAEQKAAEWSKKAEELKAQYNEQEKTELSDICRIYEMTPDKLRRLLEMTGNGLPDPRLAEAIEKEDEDNE